MENGSRFEVLTLPTFEPSLHTQMSVANAPAPNIPCVIFLEPVSSSVTSLSTYRYFTPAQVPPTGTALEQPEGKEVPALFRPIKIRGVTFQNRIFVSLRDTLSVEA